MSRFKLISFVFLILFSCEEERVYFPKQTRKAFFTFDKLRSSKQVLNQEDILKQLKSKRRNDNPKNFKVKSIKLDSDTQKKIKIKGKGVDLEMNAQSGLDFKAEIVLEQEGYEEVQLQNCEFELNAEKFIFSKFSKTFSIGGIINAPEILASIRGATEKGYSIKAIALSGNSAKVTGKKPNFKIEMVKAGNFKAKIVLQKSGNFDSEIKNCLFDIKKAAPSNLNFSIFRRPFNNGMITKTEILKQIPSRKGYTLKQIILPSGVGNVSGSKLNLKIQLLKAGNFKATIILEKENYQDAKIPNCEFVIQKNPAPKNFIFDPFLARVGDVVRKNEILLKIKPVNSRNGYILKEIILPSEMADVSGSKPNFKIKFLKAGDFKAKIILEKTNFQDAEIRDCNFVVKAIPAPRLTFSPFQRNYNNGIITTKEIMDQIRGTGKAGYTLKKIDFDNSVGNVTGTAPNFQINLQFTGRFQALITLSKPGYSDAFANPCIFEIKKNPAPVLRFNKYTRDFGGGKIITKTHILSHIKPDSEKTGYQINQIIELTGMSVQGIPPNSEIHPLKTGTFKTKIILSKPFYEDVEIDNCEFEIHPKVLTWRKFREPITALGPISNAKIKSQIRENLQGYELKNIDFPSFNGTVGGNVPNLRMDMVKGDPFKAKITLEHPDYFDVELTDCEFEYVKEPAPPIPPDWIGTLTRSLNSGKTITASQIIYNIRNMPLGYSLKEIKYISDNSIAELSGTAPNVELVLKKGGNFDATIVLRHDTKEDVEIRDADFDIEDPQIVSRKFTRYSEQGDSVSFEEMLEYSFKSNNPKWRLKKGLSGTGYTVKSISIPSSAQSKIEKSLTGLKFKKLGTSTVRITLENPDYFDVTLDAEFAMIFDYAFGDNGEDLANAAMETSDGDYLLVGFSEDKKTGKQLQGFVVKMSKLGINRFEKSFGGNNDEAFEKVVELDSGSFVAIGYKEIASGDKNIWLKEIGNDGDTTGKWEREYGGSNDDAGLQILKLSDGHLIAVGYKTTALSGVQGWVAKINKNNGNVMWEKEYGGTRDDKFFSACLLSDGNIAVAGEKTMPPGITRIGSAFGNGTHTDGWVLKLNKDNGNIIWEKTYTGGKNVTKWTGGIPRLEHRHGNDKVNTMIESDLGDLVIGGISDSASLSRNNIWSALLDSNDGRLLKNMFEPTLVGEVTEIFSSMNLHLASASHGKFFLFAGKQGNQTYILKVSSNSRRDFLRKAEYKKYSKGYIKSIVQDSDGKVVIAGYTETRGITTGFNFWVSKLDPATLKIIGE